VLCNVLCGKNEMVNIIDYRGYLEAGQR